MTQQFETFVRAILKEIRNERRNSRILYRIDKRPVQPRPERRGKGWDRDWLPKNEKGGIFMSTNPHGIRANHHIIGHVYAYRVPEWAIAASGGLHRFDWGTEILIKNDIWEKIKHSGELKFLGKSMSDEKLDMDAWYSDGSAWERREADDYRRRQNEDPALKFEVELRRMLGSAKMAHQDPEHSLLGIKMLSLRDRLHRFSIVNKAIKTNHQFIIRTELPAWKTLRDLLHDSIAEDS